jgi:predicted transcriptional regulator
MKTRHPLALTHCPHCGARIIPTPKEIKKLRRAASLTQRQMAGLLKISAAHIAYLEGGKRTPSAELIKRYWKLWTLTRRTEKRTGQR